MNPRTLLAVAAIALALPAAAQADTTQFAAFQVIEATGAHAGVPLKLHGQKAVQCDAAVQRLPFSTTCMTSIGYPNARCYISMRMVASGDAHGLVLCGRINHWTWRSSYQWHAHAKAFRWSSPAVQGPVPF